MGNASDTCLRNIRFNVTETNLLSKNRVTLDVKVHVKWVLDKKKRRCM